MTTFTKTLSAALAIAGAWALAPATAEAQPGRGGSIIDLLRMEEVQKELELVDDQMTKLRGVGESLRDEFRAAFEGLRDVPEGEREAKIAEAREKVAAKIREKVNAILLPHQRERLDQLRLQMRLRFGGASGVLESSEFTEALGVTEDQKGKLKTRAEELEKELREKTDALRKEYRNKLLQELNPDQRAKFEKMMGKEFSFPPPPDSSRGRDGRPSGERRPEA